MRAFIHLEGIAAPLPLAHVDTDTILPARFLKTVSRQGLGHALFHSLRRDAQGASIPEFILNRSPYDQACILVSLENFGCGSSREHAPWALLDFGIRCIIAPSFADIFYVNCLKNGILPIAWSRADVDELMAKISSPAEASTTVDLGTQLVSTRTVTRRFEIAAAAKRRLIEGADDIFLTLKHSDDIAGYEKRSQDGFMRPPISLAPK
jgi:3-isopropylmalate/(R)-2-methylmalate dehydratase small subunit